MEEAMERFRLLRMKEGASCVAVSVLQGTRLRFCCMEVFVVWLFWDHTDTCYGSQRVWLSYGSGVA